MRIPIWMLVLASASSMVACDDEEEAEPTEQAVEEAHTEEQPAGAVEAQQPSAQQATERATIMDGIDRAVASMHPTEGNQLSGTVRFESTNDGVRVIADFEGLEPGSRHGFHVHEFGDCTAPDATSAGGHYAPDDHPHALPPTDPRHAGDMGNAEANDQGQVHFEETFDTISIAGAENPILGRGVILHAQEDTGQGPSGEAGPRMACGVVGVAQPPTEGG